MSHIYELSKLKESCDATGQCAEYELRLQQEQQRSDHYTANANQNAVIWGLAVCIIGVFILLTPFSKLIKHLQKIILPALVAIMPVAAGLAIGAYAGFIVSFGACFKQQCSSFESASIFIIPLLSLVLTVPLAMMIYKKRSNIVKIIDQTKNSTWIIVGVLVILCTVIVVYSVIDDNIRNNEIRKAALIKE